MNDWDDEKQLQAMHELIMVHMAGGYDVDFVVRPIDIQGDFSIKLMKNPSRKDEYLCIYEVRNGKVVKE